VIRHNKGMIFHANPPATAPTRSLPAILGASSARRRPVPRPSGHGPRGRWQVKGDGFMRTFFAPLNWGMAL
jgi:hypothetical protein